MIFINMNRQRILFLLAALLSVLSSCTKNEVGSAAGREYEEGTPVTLYFEALAPEMLSTRSVADVTDLQIMVFDENQQFITRSKAILEDVQVIPGQPLRVRKFRVTLPSSSKKRYVHFIGNYDWTNFPTNYELMYANGGTVLPMLVSKGPTNYWARLVLPQGIFPGAFGERVDLLRNKAKISVNNTRPAEFRLDGFTVYHCPDKGNTIVFKFDPATLTYTFPEGIVSEPAGIGVLPPPAVAPYPDGIQLFERDQQNSPASEKIFVIVKGSYKGARVGYYKFDLLKKETVGGITTEKLYDIMRNTHYALNVAIINTGKATQAEAASGPADNNMLSSIELTDYPGISDGIASLEVDKVGEVYVNPGIFRVQVTYNPDIRNPSGADNSAVTATLLDPSGRPVVSDSYVYNFNYNKQTGMLEVQIVNLPTGTNRLEYTIHLEAKSGASVITKDIPLVLRPPFTFNASLTSLSSADNGEVLISFDVPPALRNTIFPYEVAITTKKLYPNIDAGKDDNIILKTGGGTYKYIYKVLDTQKGTRVTLHFKRSAASETETIVLESNRFVTQVLALYR